jgi:heme exporter protein D
MQIPIFKNFLATSYFKAFVLNAFVISLLTVAAMAMHASLRSPSGYLNKVFYDIFSGDEKTKTLEFETAIFINFIITFLYVLIVMIVLYVLIGFGGGMITPLNKSARKQIPFTELFK